ncbi:helix-turn-helix transcriptional regulator [Streptomyces sp. NPDC088732]|uniref:helix-turn-helix transcriptional regulator n=1 Tax=Streptomyces sp. NPDC088732 TaxID=3365879 RepID=UPI00381E190F
MPPDPLPAWLLTERRRLGHQVRSLREGAEISQEELAHRAGISRDSVLRTENATHSASVDHVLRIARALGVPVASLFN